MSLEIRCDICGMVVTHQCSLTVKEALKHLYEFRLEYPEFEHMRKEPGFEKDDMKAPFFSEGYLYSLLGKDNARTVLAVLSNFIQSMGIHPELSLWPKMTCRHQFAETIASSQRTVDKVKWCPDCGSVCRNYPSGIWEIPKVKERVGKLRKGK